MYSTFYGSVSGIIHLIARRPVVAASIALVALVVAGVPKTPPPPPTPPPPAIVSFEAPEPPAYGGSHKHISYECVFGKSAAPTNLCKATLDSIALFLGNDTAATVKVSGSMNHVLAVRKYFMESEAKLGITSDRIGIDVDGRDSDSNVVNIEQIP